ncbi:MAG TPA: gamma-glutamyltransferase [Burkholderiaceae bacterium]|nr:gamma-glutamyltransferase [Burkholderiaceae bacterium]
MSVLNSDSWRKSRRMFAIVLACGVYGAALADEADGTLGVESSVTLPPQAKGKPPNWAGQAFQQGVVSVANPYGAEAGAQILEQGGNAIDAAVAIVYALNVVEPQSAGIGGGGFMLIHLAKTGETFTIDSREKAPTAATPNMFEGKSFDAASTSGLAVGVPGMVRGTALALKSWGNLSLAQTLAPAIKLADEGFAATPRYVSASCSARARNYPESEAYFCPGGVSRVAVGELVRNVPLAETLRTIANQGPDAFYSGDIAQGIIEGQKRFRSIAGAEGGRMTLADLAAYQPAVRAPVVGKYRGYTIKAMSSPSSGGLTLLQMLGMVERFPLGNAGQGYGFGSTRTLNVMAEAMRIAFADRAVWMGDADFSFVPEKGLINPIYTMMRGAAINPDARITPNPVAGDPRPFEMADAPAATQLVTVDSFSGPGGTTTHLSVVDQWGNMVSYTNTIESSHGAGMFAGYYPPGCTEIACFRSFGFLLNNELTDFNFSPSDNPFTGEPATNDVQPHKRPRSSMTPAMIFDPAGKPIIAYGSPGGATIINSVFNVTLNLIDHGMTIQDAIDAPRLSVTAAGGAINIDNGAPGSRFNGFSPASLDGLRALGHTVNAPLDIGSVQAVVVDAKTGKQYGAADARREGTVIGLPRPRGN